MILESWLAYNSMIVFFKFESYLGGGETLVTRFSQYLHNNRIPFFVFCKKDSYIHKGLLEVGLGSDHFCAVEEEGNYYYLTNSERLKLLHKFVDALPKADEFKFVTSSMRDLYMISDLCKVVPGSVTHLILHNQDHRYVCRSLWGIVKEMMGARREFNNEKPMRCNYQILNRLNQNRSLISMSYIITELWKDDLGIIIPEDRIVSLPAFRGSTPNYGSNDKTILWIGRLVDFKFASLFSLLNFIRDNESYHLTIVGDGDRQFFMDYVNKNGIPMDRITMAGEVPYNDLPGVIAKHAIGYAAGTSIIEIAQQGKPVIMALQSNKTRKFKNDICGGLFYNTSKGNLGEDLCINREEDITTTVAEAIKEIEQNYQLASRKCFEYVNQEYNQDKNFDEYLRIIERAPRFESKDIQVPFSGYLRRFLFRKTN